MRSQPGNYLLTDTTRPPWTHRPPSIGFGGADHAVQPEVGFGGALQLYLMGVIQFFLGEIISFTKSLLFVMDLLSNVVGPPIGFHSVQKFYPLGPHNWILRGPTIISSGAHNCFWRGPAIGFGWADNCGACPAIGEAKCNFIARLNIVESDQGACKTCYLIFPQPLTRSFYPGDNDLFVLFFSFFI